jgi:hypothetical protein
MVAAINAGLEQGLFSLAPPNPPPPQQRDAEVKLYRFSISDIPCIATVKEIGWDELRFRVVLWPIENDKRQRLRRLYPNHVSDGDGELFAAGYLERRNGTWLQLPHKFELHCRDARKQTVAALNIEPRGFKDRGKFMM